MAWGSGVLVDMCNDEFQIRHRLSQCVQLRLKQVELTNGREGFVEIGDFGQLIHVLPNVADDLRIIYALIAQPFPDDSEFPM